jgi:hypothetical protein
VEPEAALEEEDDLEGIEGDDEEAAPADED